MSRPHKQDYNLYRASKRGTMEGIMNFKLGLCIASIASVLVAAMHTEVCAQSARVRTTPITPRAIVLAPAPPGAPPLTVTSPDFESMGSLDRKFMQVAAGGENKSPAIAWSPGPAGTQSYVLIAEGEGETRADPTVHWIVYDIPATATSLPQGLPSDVEIKNPAGAINGLEDSETGREDLSASLGYRGPNPPPGANHPYYFEVFALDKKLGLNPSQARRTPVINAMKGHVLASGEIVVRYSNK
jgi:Raf kinase inhibitor-like YbhB/YbcL family protein